MNKNNDYEIINGKPHLGIFYGSVIIINETNLNGKFEENPVFKMAKDKLNAHLMHIPASNPDLQTRHPQFIVRPPMGNGLLSLNGSIGLKFMIWGRAFKVMKLVKKGVKRYAKKWRGGKRKFVRVDK
jgi:hypothetical protein